MIRALHFLLLVLFALLLMAYGAHLFELPHKMALSKDAYLAAQQLYAGWNRFGVVLLLAIGVNLTLLVLCRAPVMACRLLLGSLACLLGSLAIFFIWTYPANSATRNWTLMPGDWQMLRQHWEYSHAGAAVSAFLGYCCASLAAVARMGGRR